MIKICTTHYISLHGYRFDSNRHQDSLTFRTQQLLIHIIKVSSDFMFLSDLNKKLNYSFSGSVLWVGTGDSERGIAGLWSVLGSRWLWWLIMWRLYNINCFVPEWSSQLSAVGEPQCEWQCPAWQYIVIKLSSSQCQGETQMSTRAPLANMTELEVAGQPPCTSK